MQFATSFEKWMTPKMSSKNITFFFPHSRLENASKQWNFLVEISKFSTWGLKMRHNDRISSRKSQIFRCAAMKFVVVEFLCWISNFRCAATKSDKMRKFLVEIIFAVRLENASSLKSQNFQREAWKRVTMTEFPRANFKIFRCAA